MTEEHDDQGKGKEPIEKEIITEQMRDLIQEAADRANVDPVALAETIKRSVKALAALREAIPQGGLDQAMEEGRRLFGTIPPIIQALNIGLQTLQELMPYLEEEIKKPEYNGLYIYDLWDNENEDLFLQALAAAQEARDRDKHITVQRVDSVDYPVDKVNSSIFKLLEKDTDGQVTINMTAQKDQSKCKLLAYYSIDFIEEFNGLKLDKKLTMFDKWVYIATAAAYYHGNKHPTLRQIFHNMGGVGNPNKIQSQRIYKSLVKMRLAPIYLDNAEEAERYNYPLFRYEGYLLPIEMVTEPRSINGKIADLTIDYLKEPPLLKFARLRKQITTVNVKLLQVPLNKTEDNLLLMDYLIERISRAKTKRFKIILSTLWEETGITSKKQKQRAPEKINTILSYYRQQGFIEGYSLESDYIKIALPIEKRIS